MPWGKGLRLGLHPVSVPTSPSLSPSFIKQEAGGSEHADDSSTETQWQAGPLAPISAVLAHVGVCAQPSRAKLLRRWICAP